MPSRCDEERPQSFDNGAARAVSLVASPIPVCGSYPNSTPIVLEAQIQNPIMENIGRDVGKNRHHRARLGDMGLAMREIVTGSTERVYVRWSDNGQHRLAAQAIANLEGRVPRSKEPKETAYMSILDGISAAAGFTSAIFWVWSAQVKFDAISSGHFQSGSRTVTERDLDVFIAASAKRNKLAAIAAGIAAFATAVSALSHWGG